MNTRITIWPLLLGMLLLAGGWQVVEAQNRLVLQAESRLWIEGTSTLNAFTCRTQDVEGVGFMENSATGVAPVVVTQDAPATHAEVTIPVEAFDCGKQRMNRDFYEAMKADTHPVIRYELANAEILSREAGENGRYRLRAEGRLTLAGTERSITTTLLGRRLAGGRYRIEGNQRLLMSDFGIDPPTALLGLIRTNDRILIRFDLVAASIPPSTTTTHLTQ